LEALDVYRGHFKPSPQLDRPYAMAGVNVIAAGTDAEAQRLFTSIQQAFINLRRGAPGRLPPPIDDIDAYCSPPEKAMIDQALSRSFVGSPETVERGIHSFLAETGVDELMLAANIYDHTARLRSFEIAAGLLAG
ncbi:MAG TPA: hypothetical protein VGM43_19425, partial [Bryobacteraceae bacterium]